MPLEELGNRRQHLVCLFSVVLVHGGLAQSGFGAWGQRGLRMEHGVLVAGREQRVVAARAGVNQNAESWNRRGGIRQRLETPGRAQRLPRRADELQRRSSLVGPHRDDLELAVRSPWGRLLKSIRDDEDAAASLGKNPFASLWVYFIDPLTDSYSLQEIVVKATPLVMIAIGSTDLLFALDSIPAVFGITSEAYLVFAVNAFALMGLRQLYFLLQGMLVQRAIQVTGQDHEYDRRKHRQTDANPPHDRTRHHDGSLRTSST